VAGLGGRRTPARRFEGLLRPPRRLFGLAGGLAGEGRAGRRGARSQLLARRVATRGLFGGRLRAAAETLRGLPAQGVDLSGFQPRSLRGPRRRGSFLAALERGRRGAFTRALGRTANGPRTAGGQLARKLGIA